MDNTNKMQSSSPNWKKPSDIMKKRLVRSRTSSGRAIIKTNRTSSSILQERITKNIENNVGKKRQNPFACGRPEKKVCTDTNSVAIDKDNKDQQNEQDVEHSNNIFSVLDKAEEKVEDTPGTYHESLAELQSRIPTVAKQKQSSNNPSQPTTNQSNPMLPYSTGEDDSQIENKSENPKKQYPFFPTDWSLKSKARFISSVPFSWCNPLKTNEESSGIAAFVQDPHIKANHIKDVNVDCLDAKVEFQKCGMVWMHPHIPWLKLFPRIVNENKIGKASVIFQSTEVQKSLLNDWTESLSSAFHMLRSGKSAFFYLCSHQFTVMFRSGPVPGVCEHLHAILSPTSRGIRQSLEKEGVEFTMPLNTIKTDEAGDDEDVICERPDKLAQKCSSTQKTSDLPKDGGKEACSSDQPTEEEGEDIKDTNEGASFWLETLGIDKSKYKSLNPNKVMIQRDMFKLIDNRPESAILIEGAANTMALVNFLLNSRSCVPNTGDLSGVPATILSPVAFKGATLKSCQVKQGAVRQQLSNGDIQEGFSVEITGPLLPNNILSLNRLFEQTQKQFTFTNSVVEPSTPFNLMCSCKEEDLLDIEEVEGNESWIVKDEASGHSRHVMLNLPINDKNNGRQAIREMLCDNGQYVWT